MPAQTDISNEQQDILGLYIQLRSVVQSYQKLVVNERNRFDKPFQQELAMASLEKYDIDFDNKFTSYDYHLQSIRRCRDSVARIDGLLFSMLTSFIDPYFNLMQNDTNVKPHCEATRNHTLSTVYYLDAVMNHNTLFQVYEVFDLLRNLVTYFDNWIFVLDRIIDDFGPVYNDFLDQ